MAEKKKIPKRDDAAAPTASSGRKRATKSSTASPVEPLTGSRPAAKRRATTARASPKTDAEPDTPATTPPAITPDMVARAAYLNYRRRVDLGLPGDSQTDWLEAERQLGLIP